MLVLVLVCFCFCFCYVGLIGPCLLKYYPDNFGTSSNLMPLYGQKEKRGKIKVNATLVLISYLEENLLYEKA